MTPHSLAFHVDVITTGTVLGAKPTDSPDQVTAVLGSDFAENSFDDHSMWRDYGMVEFFWGRESPDHPWEGHHFTLHVHRLSYGGGGLVNRAIRERYGRFGRHLRFDKLERLLMRRGVPMEHVPDANAPAYTLHWQPASEVSVMAFRAHADGERRRGGERIGDVYTVSSSRSAEHVASARSRPPLRRSTQCSATGRCRRPLFLMRLG
ncbi:hypothetical protein GCM10018785_45990 [Streptomyces longispororuber]|uniref:Uncharacterized protein n=1 Tax=Streptomyces longispororuber TaxID=68230 RepID=A0A918ZVG3_9ACTN|nr:hypothetical protein [Streptomyces longispororuber]GHE72629.1 hypothetical protein GCM10018785_45990 [Streptomyces longispororuber]